MSDIPDHEGIRRYFEERFSAHGATARGVDWNSDTAQEVRFDQLIKVIHPDHPFSLLDYGCGYGALAGYLLRLGFPLERYVGFDISGSALSKARELHADQPEWIFTDQFDTLEEVDYALASGSFNVKLETSFEQWTQYVLSELHKMDSLTRRGFSFNLLTKYSDAPYMRPHLYYADPCYLFDYCKRHFSRNVALLHDYEIYDFTILVRK